MKKPATIEIKLERTIPAPPSEVYAAWLNRKIPGTPWNESAELILNPKVNGFFYWRMHKTPHYGRFTQMKRGALIQHTWMSPYTQGQETMVTVTFKKMGDETLMTLVHADLPNNADGRAHQKGWTYFLDRFPKQFGKTARKKK